MSLDLSKIEMIEKTDIMLESPKQFSKIRNFGHSSEQELFALRTFVQNTDRSQIVSYCEEKGTDRIFPIDIEAYSSKSTTLEAALNKKVEGCEILFINSTGEYCDDIDIVDLNLSARTTNLYVFKPDIQNVVGFIEELDDISKIITGG